MNKDELLLLVGEIQESRIVLGNIPGLYGAYEPGFRDEQKRDIRDAVMYGGYFLQHLHLRQNYLVQNIQGL